MCKHLSLKDGNELPILHTTMTPNTNDGAHGFLNPPAGKLEGEPGMVPKWLPTEFSNSTAN